jgi:hypothetical protein
MKLISVSIKANAFNTNAKGLFCNRFTYNLRGFFVGGIGELVPHAFCSCARGNKRRSRNIIDNLGVDMPVRTKHRQPWSVWCSEDFLSHVILTPQCRFF